MILFLLKSSYSISPPGGLLMHLLKCCVLPANQIRACQAEKVPVLCAICIRRSVNALRMCQNALCLTRRAAFILNEEHRCVCVCVCVCVRERESILEWVSETCKNRLPQVLGVSVYVKMRPSCSTWDIRNYFDLLLKICVRHLIFLIHFILANCYESLLL